MVKLKSISGKAKEYMVGFKKKAAKVNKGLQKWSDNPTRKDLGRRAKNVIDIIENYKM